MKNKNVSIIVQNAQTAQNAFMEFSPITNDTTLGELLAMLNLGEKPKTPTPRVLFETAGEPIVDTNDCTLFSNGFAIYKNRSGRTVVWLPYCTSFIYYFNKLRDAEKDTLKETYSLPDGFLETQPWIVAVTIIGDHRIEQNSMNRTGSRMGTTDFSSQDNGDKDGEMEAVVADPYRRAFNWYDGHIGENPLDAIERRETREEMLAAMTDKQREVFVMYYRDGMTQEQIHYMILNEKYAGDIITQKFYTKSFLDYRNYRNNGVLPSVYLKDHHEAIIPRHQFDRCNVIFMLKKKTTPLQYPFSEYLCCPYCGHVLHHRRLDIQYVDSHFCCEGEGACRGFAIMAIPVKKAILSAYEHLDIRKVERIAGMKHRRKAEAAELLLRIKAEYASFSVIDYWWLDDLVERISFGMHSHTASDLKEGGIDDRTITITWKCGIVTTVPSGVVRDSHDPKHKARLWDAFVLRYPERYPKLAEEIRKK